MNSLSLYIYVKLIKKAETIQYTVHQPHMHTADMSLISTNHHTAFGPLSVLLLVPTGYFECVWLSVAYTTGIITEELASTSAGHMQMVIEAL